MTPEGKQLLLKDLCARLPYGVKCAIFDNKLPFEESHGKYPFEMDGISIEENEIDVWLEKGNFNIETIKPYLRPMSSMTEEEFKEYHSMLIDVDNSGLMNQRLITKIVDWLDEKMFDHRNLVPKGLALEAQEAMYKTK